MPIIVTETVATALGRTFLDLQNESLSDDFALTKHRPNAKRFLNEAARIVARRVRVPELEAVQTIATVAGTFEVELDAEVVRVNSLRNTTDRNPLDDVKIEEIDDLPASSGKPSIYAHVGRRLVLYPTPNAVYALEARVQGRAFEMVNDTDEPAMVDDYRGLLVTYTRSRLFRLEDDFEMSRAWMDDFEKDLALYAGDVRYEDRSRVRKVRGMFAGARRLSAQRP